jgi:hypothetical protein
MGLCVYIGPISHSVGGKLESPNQLETTLNTSRLPSATLLLHCIAIPPVALQPLAVTVRLVYI